MNVLYGIENRYTDVTNILQTNKVVTIPSGDINRSNLFGGDPLQGILKHVKINDTIYDDQQKIIVNFITNTVENFTGKYEAKLSKIHSKSIFKYGCIGDEYPEQLMAVQYIRPDNKVLEIGGNIGRNSIVISNLLNDSSNLVVLESDSTNASQLQENRDLNNLSFHVENSAISMRKLCQVGWDTFPYDTEMPSHAKPVMTIGFEELVQKYSIKFDTLVADCEGALFYILQDFPNMLDNIQSIIMENDYHILSQKEKVDEIIKLNGFKRVYFEGNGWGPCQDRFYEVWQK